MIIHPKKVEDDNNLNVASIFGSAKSTQESDTVMILQKHEDNNLRTIMVKKNRYDGEVGNQHLAFNKENRRYFEISHHEFKIIESKQGTAKSLIDYRKKKHDGEVEPELAEISKNNPRAIP